MTVTRQRIVLIAVFAIFFVPVLAAWILRLNPMAFGTTNHGVLIQPPRLVDPAGLSLQRSLDGSPSLMRGEWTVALPSGPEGCQAPCQETLFASRQARTAVNKDFGRVRRVLLVTHPVPGTELEALINSHPDLSVAVAPAGWLQAFRAASATPASAFLVDPRGFQFMAYPGKLDATDMLKDLKRVLKISAVD